SGRSIPTREAVEQEAARRLFARAEDVDALVDRYRVDVAEVHLADLVARISADPIRAEATRLGILRTAGHVARRNPPRPPRALARSPSRWPCSTPRRTWPAPFTSAPSLPVASRATSCVGGTRPIAG